MHLGVLKTVFLHLSVLLALGGLGSQLQNPDSFSLVWMKGSFSVEL